MEITEAVNATHAACKGGGEERLQAFFDGQLTVWHDARKRFEDLKKVLVREVNCNEQTIKIQFNPARMVSTGAKIDKAVLAQRPCFLCEKNRPEVQTLLPAGDNFELLVNPFPILPVHFTIPAKQHQPQLIWKHYGELHALLHEYPHLLVFYNGPKCGASAPDHLHFQAGTSGMLPLQKDWERLWKSRETLFKTECDSELAAIDTFVCPLFVIKSKKTETDTMLFRLLYKALPQREDETEPMLNILAWREVDSFITVVVPREKHRPDCYLAEGDEKYLISPGAIDMGGLIITPRKEDFDRLTGERIAALYKEVGMSKEVFAQVKSRLKQDITKIEKQHKHIIYNNAPEVSVGILNGSEVHFDLHSAYNVDGKTVTGPHSAELKDGKIAWNGGMYTEIEFRPADAKASFSLHNVTIGVNFHWEQQQTQTFLGTLRLVVEGETIYAINSLSVEDYLESVISSEMSATSSVELLKAHAVISRSWLLAQMQNRGKEKQACTCMEQTGELIKWYDREDHTLFDVCADDHCQRYQGISKATNKHVSEAVRETRGQVLLFDDEICDARFSKCCGGMMEEYQYCWEDIDKPYLQALRDAADEHADIDLTKEAESETWIRSAPDAFCNTTDRKVLSQVLNDFDQTTTDFYRWQVSYTQEQISQLISSKLNIDFGHILELVPVERGKSGRLSKLKIVGSKRTLVVGKELEIRRALSESHLYSSAFIVDATEKDAAGVPQRFVITGAGWGHGVGLCQIGAAVMGEQGYKYNAILTHYYPGAELKELYK